MTLKDALKGKKVYIYARVSTEEQTGTLPQQIKTVKEGLKKLGYTGKPEIYSEQASGTNKNREELNKMLDKVKQEKRPSIVVVRDIQRFSRDPYDLGELYNPIRELEVPILSINENMVLGTRKIPEPQSDLVAPILVSAGGAEVSTRKKQTIQGVQRSREKGIVAGSPIDLYPKDGLEPRSELIRLLKANISGAESARRLNKSTSWVRKTKAQVERILVAGGDSLLADWLDAIKMVRDMEIERGEGMGKKAKAPMRAVRRMTSGYINNPMSFPKPTDADLMNYFTNFENFKPKRQK